MKDKEGTIETLERQLVQAGIKMKVQQGESEVRKEVLSTEAQQKLLRGMMQNEFQNAKKDIQREVKDAVLQAKIDSKKDFDKNKEK